MIIERNIAPYVVFAEDPILTALHKISANGQRIIFLVNESGILRGSLSDGDFRRWLIANPHRIPRDQRTGGGEYEPADCPRR